MSEAVEVWLRQPNLEIRGFIFREDETGVEVPVRSLNMRGAQREVTGRLRSEGWSPADRWTSVTEGETVRRFRR